jgi:hypothetical protein
VSQQINLFNPIFLKQKKIFTALPMAEALGIIVAGALLLNWYAARSVSELEQEAAAGKAMLAKREQRLTAARPVCAARQGSGAGRASHRGRGGIEGAARCVVGAAGRGAGQYGRLCRILPRVFAPERERLVADRRQHQRRRQ